MRTRQAPLAQYRRKRDFSQTAEPQGLRRKGGVGKSGGERVANDLSFTVQRHAARTLHYDFRLDGGKLRGRWMLVRMPQKESETKHNWLLIKDADGEARRGIEADIIRRKPERAKRSLAAGKNAIPALLAPQLASDARQVPSGEGWVFETKYDGYRLLARLDNGEVKLFTRSGKNWTARFPCAAKALSRLRSRNAWIDGEAVVFSRKGLTDFSALQNALEDSAGRTVVFVAFDLPFVDGEDLRVQPLEARRKRLERLFSGRLDPGVVLAQNVMADGNDALRAACKLGLEGLIAKRLDSPYCAGRSRSWLKLKCRPRDEFVIGGFTEPEGARSGIGAVLVGE